MPQNSNISDLALIQSFKSSGNQNVLGRLYENYIEMVYGVGLKYFKNETDAEDLVVNVYELISLKLKSHKVDNFKSWLYVVTKNYCLEQLRKQSKNYKKEKEATNMYSELIFHPDNINKEDVFLKLEDCIKELKYEQKVCIESFYYNSMSYHQIAHLLKLDWNTVRSYIQNGRRMLKNCIDKK